MRLILDVGQDGQLPRLTALVSTDDLRDLSVLAGRLVVHTLPDVSICLDACIAGLEHGAGDVEAEAATETEGNQGDVAHTQ